MKMLTSMKFWLSAFTLSALLTSCIEEGTDDAAGKGIDEFRFDNEEFDVVTFKPSLANQTTTLVTIYRDAVSTGSMSEEVTISFEVNSDSLAAYNTKHSTSYIEVDPAWYTLSVHEGTLTFAPNEGAKTISITLDTNPFDLSKQYVIPLVINNASSGYALNENRNLTIVQTLPINQYDGVYSYSGSLGRFDATSCAALNDGLDGAIVAGVETDLVTTGANSVDFNPVWASGASGVAGVGDPRIDVDPVTNNITLVAVNAAPLNWGPIPGQPNKYDPVSKTFTINWKWGATCATSPTGTTRAMIGITMTYIEPR